MENSCRAKTKQRMCDTAAGPAPASPGVKLLPVLIKGPVEVIPDEVFCLHLSRTNSGNVVPIHYDVHQRVGADAGHRADEDEKLQRFGRIHSRSKEQQNRCQRGDVVPEEQGKESRQMQQA